MALKYKKMVTLEEKEKARAAAKLERERTCSWEYYVNAQREKKAAQAEKERVEKEKVEKERVEKERVEKHS